MDNLWIWLIYPLVMSKWLLNMAIETVDSPINIMAMFHRDAKLPEDTGWCFGKLN